MYRDSLRPKPKKKQKEPNDEAHKTKIGVCQPHGVPSRCSTRQAEHKMSKCSVSLGPMHQRRTGREIRARGTLQDKTRQKRDIFLPNTKITPSVSGTVDMSLPGHLYVLSATKEGVNPSGCSFV